jgi:hypothetical protein
MKQPLLVLLAILGSLAASATWAQGPPYPPLSEYMIPRDAKMALARSAAPAAISDRATVKVLTASGYQVAHDGDNGFVCMVMRGWSAPTYTPAQFRDLVYDAKVRAPICFDPGSITNRDAVLRAAKQAWDAGQNAGPDRRWGAGRLCQTRAAEARRGQLRVHVVRGPESRVRSWRVASSRDDLRPVPRKLVAGRQRVR